MKVAKLKDSLLATSQTERFLFEIIQCLCNMVYHVRLIHGSGISRSCYNFFCGSRYHIIDFGKGGQQGYSVFAVNVIERQL